MTFDIDDDFCVSFYFYFYWSLFWDVLFGCVLMGLLGMYLASYRDACASNYGVSCYIFA